MQILGRTLAQAAGILAVGVLSCTASLWATSRQASAQIDSGDFWLYQPQQTGPVGRAWSSAGHTAEYWAYVAGEYRWANASNGPANRWHLDAERISSTTYPNFASFKAAVLALPEMQGKTILFQNHSVTEEITQN